MGCNLQYPVLIRRQFSVKDKSTFIIFRANDNKIFNNLWDNTIHALDGHRSG